MQRNIVALNGRIGSVRDKTALASIAIELNEIIGQGRHYSKQLDLLIDSFAAKELEFFIADARALAELRRAATAALQPPGNDGASLVAMYQAKANGQAWIASFETGMNYLDALMHDLREGAYRRARGIDTPTVESILAHIQSLSI